MYMYVFSVRWCLLFCVAQENTRFWAMQLAGMDQRLAVQAQVRAATRCDHVAAQHALQHAVTTRTTLQRCATRCNSVQPACVCARERARVLRMACRRCGSVPACVLVCARARVCVCARVKVRVSDRACEVCMCMYACYVRVRACVCVNVFPVV